MITESGKVESISYHTKLRGFFIGVSKSNRGINTFSESTVYIEELLFNGYD